ncbi:MAG TPA: hypothetical protein VF695_11075 [Sphingomonas sp.]|jgi:hypothetical protein
MTPHTPAAVNQPATYLINGSPVSVPVMVDFVSAHMEHAMLKAQIAANADYIERLDAIIARVERVLS